MSQSNILQQKNMNNSNNSNLDTKLSHQLPPPTLSSLSSISSSSSVDSTTNTKNDKKLTSFSRITKEYNEYKFDVCINNVVCSYSTQCHLNLKRIASDGINVEYKRENGMANMKIRNPNTTASIWSSGKITCTGAKSELEAKKAARRYCRVLQKIGFRVKFCNYRIVNVLSTFILPFELDIVKIANKYPKECSYEPELHPGATYKIKELKTTLKLFTTGSVTMTSPSVGVISQAIDKIYPILYEFRKIKQQLQQQPTPQQQVTIPVTNNTVTTTATATTINNNIIITNNNNTNQHNTSNTPTIILSESISNNINNNNNNFICNNNNNNPITATATTTITTTINSNNNHHINNNNNSNLNNTDDINNYLNAFDDYPSYNHTYMTNNDNLHHHNYNKHKQFCVFEEDELFS